MFFKKNKNLKEFADIASQCQLVVDAQVQKRISSLKDENFNSEVFVNSNYLVSFQDNLYNVKSRIIGKPDSFIVAACLFTSILMLPVVKTNSKSDSLLDPETFNSLININADIAIAAALEIISEPKTYYSLDDSTNDYSVEEKHKKVDIHIPEGIIKDSPLEKRVIVTALNDNFYGSTTSIMQLSNFFHLIYLYCQ